MAHKLKLSEGGAELYEKMDDGVILCKMINLAAPDTIDERVINTGLNIPIFKVSWELYRGGNGNILNCSNTRT